MIRGLRASVVATVALAILGLTACSGSPTYADLDGEADPLPPAVVDGRDPELVMNPNSAHHVGEFDERAFYLVDGGLPHLICVVIYRNDDDWDGQCGQREQGFDFEYGGLTITVAPDGAAVLEDGTRVGNNIVLTVPEE